MEMVGIICFGAAFATYFNAKGCLAAKVDLLHEKFLDYNMLKKDKLFVCASQARLFERLRGGDAEHLFVSYGAADDVASNAPEREWLLSVLKGAHKHPARALSLAPLELSFYKKLERVTYVAGDDFLRLWSSRSTSAAATAAERGRARALSRAQCEHVASKATLQLQCVF